MLAYFSLVLHCLTLAVGIYAIYEFLFHVEPNECEMTYMFENPKYHKIDLSPDYSKLYPGYNLYYYTEGQRGMKLNGYPALFIPGNAGSYKQSRSLGSVALRMSEQIKLSRYNFFAIDFNGEFSGIFGSLLIRQTNFTKVCVEHILSLYNGRHKSVAIVGHSMGGLVARALFSLDDFNHSSVPVVITQATPHKRPVLFLDKTMQNFYKSTNEAWRKMSDRIYYEIKKGNDPFRVTLVSTGGGERDKIVLTDLTGLSWVGHHHHAVWTSTYSMPLAWVSTDHLCHVWCKQVVMTTVRALYDVINPLTYQISTNSTLRYEVMRYHFRANYGDQFHILTPPSRSFLVNSRYKWEFVKAPWRHSRQTYQPKYIAIDISGLGETSVVMVITSHIYISDWIGSCTPNAPAKTCYKLHPLLSHGFLLPNKIKSPYKVVQLTYEQLKLQKYVVLYLPSSHYSFTLVDIYQPKERMISLEHSSLMRSPSLPSYFWIWPKLELTLKGPSYYSLTMRSLSYLNVYDVKVNTFQCASDDITPSVMVFSNQRREYPTYSVINAGNTSIMQLKLISKGMELPSKLKEQFLDAPNLELSLYFTSECTYSIVMLPSISGILAQVARFYTPYIPAFVAATTILQLGGHYSNKKHFYNAYIMPMVAFMMVALITKFVGLDQLLKMRHDLTFTRGFDWIVVFALFIFSMSVSHLLALLANLSCKICSFVLYPLYITSKKLKSCFDIFAKIAFILLCFSPVISHLFCGSIALFIVVLAYSGKAIQNEFEVKLKLKNSEKSESMVYASTLTSIYLVSLLHALFNIPTLVVWFKDIHNFYLLNDDPSFIHSCVSGIVFCWLQMSGYHENSLGCKSNLVWLTTLVMSTSVVLYGTIRLYRISYIIDALFITLAVHSTTFWKKID